MLSHGSKFPGDPAPRLLRGSRPPPSRFGVAGGSGTQGRERSASVTRGRRARLRRPHATSQTSPRLFFCSFESCAFNQVGPEPG